MPENDISYEYIRGLVDGEGCFSFFPGSKRSNGTKYRIPAFVLGMHERDRNLIEKVKEKLGLRNKIYFRKAWRGDGANRGSSVVLVVREFDQLKDVIIPMFYRKLKGHKRVQFANWIMKIGSDPNISDRYKSLYSIYKLGIYDRKGMLDKFID